MPDGTVDKPDWSVLVFVYSLLTFTWVTFTSDLFWGRCWPYIQRFREILTYHAIWQPYTLYSERGGWDRAREHQPDWERKTEKGIHAERKPESAQQTLCHLESGGPITPDGTVSTESAL